MTRPRRLPGLIGNTGFQLEVGLLRFYARYPVWQIRRRLRKENPRMTLPTGLRLELPRDNPLSSTFYVSACNVDWGGERTLVGMLDARRDFVDVGANIGYYAMLAAPRVRSVYAFEPDPRNLAVLHRNAAQAGNVTIVERAAAAATGPAWLDVSRNPTVSRLVERDGERTIAADATTLDDYAGETPELDPAVIKIDVEGLEGDVVAGGRRLIERSQPLIFMELGMSASELFALVATLPGYAVFAHLKRKGRVGRLEPVMPSSLEEGRAKMVFLVPRRLRARFVEVGGRADMPHRTGVSRWSSVGGRK